MIINCLAHLSRSYHPKLSLVSKRFRSLILSSELLFARSHLKTQEHVLDVCLKLPGCRLPSWFSLWIRPDQILTNDMEEDKSTTRNTLLVPIPSSVFIFSLCSRFIYGHGWVQTTTMKVARENPMVAILDGKIYVVGGCKADETTN
uniref:F-box domain-containing protein n=1 Tax=Brassica oleracea TaxID=3712 RepID=A0A3P6E2M6_BRAOL|nr:unnamed protein product [Brassica oleracea]